MTQDQDRLGQLWARFQSGTSARLTGASVENTVRPSRADSPRYLAPEQQLARAVGAPQTVGTPDPVAAAAQQLKASMEAGRKRGRKAPPPKMSAPEDLIAAQVLRDMKATEARTRRRETDYLSYAASMQADAQRRKKRKFLGLF